MATTPATPDAQIVKLNIIPTGITPVVYASQYDVGRPITFELYDGEENNRYLLDETYIPVIMGTKPDDTIFAYTCDIVEGNATINTKIQMVAVSGNIRAELVLYKDNDIIGSINMIISVEASGINRYANISHTDIPAIIDQAKSNAEEAKAASELAQKSIEDVVMWAAVAEAHAVGVGKYTDMYGEEQTITDEFSSKKWSVDAELYKAWSNAYASGEGTYTDMNGNTQTVTYEKNSLDRSVLADYYQAQAQAHAVGEGFYEDRDGYEQSVTDERSAKQLKCDTDYLQARVAAYLTGIGYWTDFYDQQHTEVFEIYAADAADISAKNAALSKAHASGQGEWVDRQGDKHVEVDEENSKSYAIGGTGTRDGENTDNAKYYYEWCLKLSRPFVGATATVDGFYGYVPTPLAGQDDEALMGNGAFGYTSKISYKGNHKEAVSNTLNTASDYGTADGKGLYITGSSNDNNTPANFGNVLNLIGDGSGQFLTEWITGNTVNTGNLYYRSHGSSSNAGWGPWKRVAYTNSTNDTYVEGAYKLGKSSIGSGTNPIYIDSQGYPQRSSSSVGSSNVPIYLSGGTLRQMTSPLPVSLGGTGSSSMSGARDALGVTNIISGYSSNISSLEARVRALEQKAGQQTIVTPTEGVWTGAFNYTLTKIKATNGKDTNTSWNGRYDGSQFIVNSSKDTIYEWGWKNRCAYGGNKDAWEVEIFLNEGVIKLFGENKSYYYRLDITAEGAGYTWSIVCGNNTMGYGNRADLNDMTYSTVAYPSSIERKLSYTAIGVVA